jgi:hypothetical protein
MEELKFGGDGLSASEQRAQLRVVDVLSSQHVSGLRCTSIAVDIIAIHVNRQLIAFCR